MRVVLYTDDFEPITVVKLPESVLRHVERYGHVVVPVLEPIKLHNVMSAPAEPRRVRIRAERLRTYGGQEHSVLFTADEESALLLKSVFLPGQYGHLQEEQRRAFARGFLHALQQVR